MKKSNISLLSVFILFACSQQKVVEDATVDTISTPSLHIPSANIRDTSNFLQRDSLLLTWYNHLLDISSSDLNFHSEKKPQLNKYVSGQIDMIERLTFKESNLLIYRATDKNILISSDIRNSEISLSKEIKIGISRDELLKELNAQSNRDTITVTDFEGNSNITLILNNNLLTRIIYSGYID